MNSLKPKIALFGRHSIRTPFAYETYKRFLAKKVDFVGLDEDPDLIVTGFSKDFFDAIGTEVEVYLKSRQCKNLVVSEEPLWDTIYSPQYQDNISSHVAAVKDTDIMFYFYGHLNSDLYNFYKTPYYLTTSTRYLTNYTVLINSILSKYSSCFFSGMAGEPVFGMFEKRIEPWFDYCTDEAKCLCIYRSLLAEELHSDANISGLGHAENTLARQKLPDWHLDKLAQSYNKYCLVMAIENTCHKDYVTEKIFDAYAVGAVPIYYGGVEHAVQKKIGLSSYIDVSDLEADEAASTILKKKQDIHQRTDQFFDDLMCIADNVLDPSNYWNEIEARSNKLCQIIYACLE